MLARRPICLWVYSLSRSKHRQASLTYPYLNLINEAAYMGRSIAVIGRTARGGRGTIGTFSDFGGDPLTAGAGINSTRTYQFSYSNTAGQNDDAFAEAGDSGSPSLVDQGGVAALVGVHLAVANNALAGTTITFDTFVPNYITELNERMEAEGYHMTEALPASVDLGVTQQVTGTLRAGYPFSISVAVSNPDTTDDVNNLRAVPGLAGSGRTRSR